jgi:hypothetical protein
MMTLIARNRSLFAARFPAVLARLDQLGTPLSTPCCDEGGRPVNIDLGRGLLYPCNEPDWSDAQLANHGREPDQIAFKDPSYCNISPVSHVMYKELTSMLRDKDWIDSLSAVPCMDVGYHFVFGIGLGYQVQRLIERTTARRLVLIEPYPEFLIHSLAAVDWDTLITAADNRRIDIEFVFGDDPAGLSRKIESIVGFQGNTFIEGSEFYATYYAWILEETYRLFRMALKTHYITSGFFEDELGMISNSIGNLAGQACWLVEGRRHLDQGCPVILVGAGPSLDQDMEALRRLKDRAIVVSCGTAIGILLKNGIRPDLHCELERGELVYTLLAAQAEAHGFDGIGLIASTTVDPRVGDLFARRWFFFRHPLSPAKLLSGRARPLARAEPLCCNAALASLAALGFRRFLLFGLDLGQKQEGRHHARDSVYFAPEHADLDQVYRRRFDRRVPGNFGGEVETWWAFDHGRRSLAHVLRQMRLDVTNCSDGAEIEGALPKVAAAVRLPALSVPKAAIIARVEQQMRHCPAGSLLREVDLGGHRQAPARYIECLAAVLAAARGRETSFFDLERDLHAALAPDAASCQGFTAIAGGSVRAMLRLGHFYGARLPDGARKRVFFDFFLDVFEERTRRMADEIREVLDRTTARVEHAASGATCSASASI